MVKMLAKLGDVIEIPLSNGKFVSAQYVGNGEQAGLAGPLIRLFSPVRSNPVSSLSEIDFQSELIPPVFVGINPPLRTKRWRIIGNVPYNEFEFPRFRYTSDLTPGTKTNWKIINPDGSWDVVGSLPQSMQKLGFPYVYSADTLDRRLTTGRYAGDSTY